MITSLLLKPAQLSTKCLFCASATGRGMEMFGLPLMEMAPEKRPLALGTDSKAMIEVPPELWPANVTLVGSPPKLAMFDCTQLSASS